MSDEKKEEQESTNNNHKILRIFINLLMILVLCVLGILIWQRVTKGQAYTPEFSFLESNEEEKSTQVEPANIDPSEPELLPYNLDSINPSVEIQRISEVHTNIPPRPRTDVITYTVKKGDTLFEIAENFGIKPETVLFSNYEVLGDNPHILSPDMVLNILPVDGAYYQWKDGDSLGYIASYYDTDLEGIIEYSGNNLDLTTLENDNNGIIPGTMVIIPGGMRPIKDWGPPAITRQNPASARFYGAGHCGAVYTGAIGTGSFVWPTVSRSVTGYTYSGIHPAVDIGGAMGNAIFAADSGVVVYSGWSDFGYGYLIVIDHGNGFQTAYAHLSTLAVTCGQSVFQGGYIGGMGSTGNSSGPHLHFELMYNGAKLNPLDYIY